MVFILNHAELSDPHSPAVAIIGGGPAGLMAAEVISQAGFSVSVYDAMPSPGRKFLLAGVGGMNITHSESAEKFRMRYAGASNHLAPLINAFNAQALRHWVHDLGIDTFVGSSGRVFPKEMKAAPLLRAWLHRLRESGVKFYQRHAWQGWHQDGGLEFLASLRNSDQVERINIRPQACVLALGGASWPQLGSNGAWVNVLREKNIPLAPLQPSNCGFEIAWSEFVRSQCAGQPLPTVNLSVMDCQGNLHSQRGECVISERGIEGGAIYALSGILREIINAQSTAALRIDLLPDYSEQKILGLLQKPRGKDSFSNFLRKQFKLPAVKLHLLRELTPVDVWKTPALLAAAMKSLSVNLLAPCPIAEAISSAGGVTFAALNKNLMLHNLPGVFCAGEMLDWEAPTGGYLLTACFATGRAAGLGAVNWLKKG